MAESTSNSSSGDGELATASIMRTLKLVIEYDGTGLCGWQRQDNGPTVQQHIEEAIRSMTHTDTQILGASRTDAGVHALGQVAIFQTDGNISSFGFRRGINTALPHGIAVRSIEEVDSSFHPRFDAKGKHYRYTILNRPPPSPLMHRYSWHKSKLLDIKAMREAAAVLIGEHDFSAFRASGCGAITPNRNITKIEIHRNNDQVYIEVWGNAFLRNMVRIIAGSLVSTGQDRLSATELKSILESRDRRKSGQTAPARGLCLIEVFF